MAHVLAPAKRRWTKDSYLMTGAQPTSHPSTRWATKVRRTSLLEHTIHINSITFEKLKIISDDQHGFRKYFRSCVSQERYLSRPTWLFLSLRWSTTHSSTPETPPLRRTPHPTSHSKRRFFNSRPINIRSPWVRYLARSCPGLHLWPF